MEQVSHRGADACSDTEPVRPARLHQHPIEVPLRVARSNDSSTIVPVDLALVPVDDDAIDGDLGGGGRGVVRLREALYADLVETTWDTCSSSDAAETCLPSGVHEYRTLRRGSHRVVVTPIRNHRGIARCESTARPSGRCSAPLRRYEVAVRSEEVFLLSHSE